MLWEKGTTVHFSNVHFVLCQIFGLETGGCCYTTSRLPSFGTSESKRAITSTRKGQPMLGPKGDAPKVKEPNLLFPAVFCANLRFPAKICGFLRFPAPSKCLGNASLFTKFLFTIFALINPPPPNQANEGFPLEFPLEGPQTELRTLSQNCEQTPQKLRTNRIMNKRAFLNA